MYPFIKLFSERGNFMKILLIILSAVSLTFCQGIRAGIDAGVSNSNISGTDAWNTGFVIAANLYYAPTNNITFGIRTTYNRWSPDADSFLNQLPVELTNGKLKGSATLWEFVPAIRIAANIAQSQVGLFGHFGAGLFIIAKDVDGKGKLGNNSFSQNLIDSTENLWGISMGLGISVGRFNGFTLEILPLYHVLDLNDFPRQYYTLTLGLSYEF
jgi:hypothetical protein